MQGRLLFPTDATTVFKTVAPVDGKIEPARGLHQIEDCFSLSQPYGSLELTPELVEIVAAWPDLPEALKSGIVAMVEAARR